jgi:hypothetical protein
METKLRVVDELLNDDALIDGVLEAMRGRFAQSGRRGRYGTPAEVALRMLVLKHRPANQTSIARVCDSSSTSSKILRRPPIRTR